VKHFIQKAKRKSEQINELMSTYQLQKEEVLFMGDDLPDLDAFSVSGLKTCPADAATEIKIQADYISPRNGGDGAVRDVIEKVMRTQDKWHIQDSTQSI
jgi:3-deoxy-D-manno-octulosonate 8-phosphate phosphatase (KDO 8-P phosphatase)